MIQTEQFKEYWKEFLWVCITAVTSMLTVVASASILIVGGTIIVKIAGAILRAINI